ncbi:hypothetical protein HMPREF1981_02958 [Bacteroides pyogenes F0041]|uniref:Uncharacterized protein n=1 Tax=Bacteroides pyogenes F0041 TaxID=1321819 RepID=U2DJU9_9BACE|nr:hypothetical protein HMPREF1981_02958 [Bacteroides pyogenes F0041]
MVQSGRHSGYFHRKITAISSCRTEAGALNASVRNLRRRFVKRRIAVSKEAGRCRLKNESLFIKKRIIFCQKANRC